MENVIERKTDEEKEKEEEKELRRNKFYNKTGESNITHRRRQIFIFSPADLDNEDVIARVEQTPTYRRTKEELQQIRNTTTPVHEPVLDDIPQPETAPVVTEEPTPQPEVPFAGFSLD